MCTLSQLGSAVSCPLPHSEQNWSGFHCLNYHYLAIHRVATTTLQPEAPQAHRPPGPPSHNACSTAALATHCLLPSATAARLHSACSFSHCCMATHCLLFQPLLLGYTLPAPSATATRLHTACSFSHCYTATHCLLFQPLCMATHCSTVKAGSQYDATLTQRDAKRRRMWR